MDRVKPQCGTGNSQDDEYDLGLHVAGLFLVLAASCLGCGFPVAAKKIKWLKIPPKIFFICKHFGTGVLIATAFVHLLPTAFQSLGNPCLPKLFTEDYPPLPGVIMMASLFALFVVEMWLNAKTGGHSHGGPTGHQEHVEHVHAHAHPPAPSPPPQSVPKPVPQVKATDLSTQEPPSLDAIRSTFEQSPPSTSIYDAHDVRQGLAESSMPPWFVVFYEQYVRQQAQLMEWMGTRDPSDSSSERGEKTIQDSSFAAPELDEEQAVDPEVYRKMSTNITLLEGGILFHSVFVGMTVSITVQGFPILLIAILFHQMFEGLGLGSRIAAVPYPKGSIRPWVLVFAFGTTAPIGQAIGLAARNSYDPQSAFGLIIVGVFNAISSGLLIYAALVDLLAEDFLSEEANRLLTGKNKAFAFCFVLLGATGMAIVGAFA
ncbi:hypothetical protein CDD82_4439 [Ophiocordyceps australis]|uniref:Zinc/iron permease n=1 Tax=Ophiocordyceps australis TaxID=1399860 RepID=A0A2C5Z6I2_9HYPO|nr:hypothetical protein CDD82_4439 [Ophiocordyceps australis]